MAVSDLTDREREAMLDAAKKIRSYKLMQAKGYERITVRAKNERFKRLLSKMRDNELNQSEYWTQKIQQLSSEDELTLKDTFVNYRVWLLMSILGIRGFFEWAIIAEDESVEALAAQATNIRNLTASEEWMRITSDERLHIERIKKDILGMEGWEMGGGGGVRDLIFGANDGLVSILATVVGVYGAMTESYAILIAGIVAAVSGAISMGAGAYLSSKSEKEVTEKESERKGFGIRGTSEEEKKKLVKFYQIKGFKRKEAESIAERVSSEMKLKETYAISKETGLTSEESWSPIKAASLTGLSFAVASLIPILPFVFLTVTPAVITAALASIACLFGVGASKAIFTRKSWFRSGVEMMTIGTLASVITYLIGLVIPA